MMMETYIAFLRGVNVSGSNPLKMEALRTSMQSWGFASVITYIQSGNLAFKLREAPAHEIARIIHDNISTDFGLSVPVLVKSVSYLELIIKTNPFIYRDQLPVDFLHATLLEQIPEPSLIKALLPLNHNLDEGLIVEDRIYLYCPQGYGQTKFTNTYFEKRLRLSATTRNWKTILKMRDIALEI